ncbi:hypothetical protein GALL_406010 [mine drainage metagenome]|uniref:Uncharacterized protein n=1 Tax=mine drainage metagenome TaxID=410659 RepID=A0A1J5QCQ9_9ZZZZ
MRAPAGIAWVILVSADSTSGPIQNSTCAFSAAIRSEGLNA